LGWSWGRHYTRGDGVGRGKKRDKGEQHEKKYEKVGGQKSANAFWQDLTATGGDVEVEGEGGREFNESSRSVPNTWQTSEEM
jgi:hypothetical protein